MKYRLLVTKEDGSKEPVEVEALNLQEAKDELLAVPEIADVQPIKPSESRAISSPVMQSAIDQYVGTEQDALDIVGDAE